VLPPDIKLQRLMKMNMIRRALQPPEEIAGLLRTAGLPRVMEQVKMRRRD